MWELPLIEVLRYVIIFELNMNRDANKNWTEIGTWNQILIWKTHLINVWIGFYEGSILRSYSDKQNPHSKGTFEKKLNVLDFHGLHSKIPFRLLSNGFLNRTSFCFHKIPNCLWQCSTFENYLALLIHVSTCTDQKSLICLW